MNFRLKPLAQALAWGLPIGLQFWPDLAVASLVSTTSTTFSGNASKAAVSPFGQPATVTVNADGLALSTANLSKFSPAVGVLTGVQLGTAASSLQQTEATNAGRLSVGTKALGTSTGVVAVGLDASGVSASSAQFSLNASCLLATSSKSCSSSNSATRTVTLAATVNNDQLADYVGETGTVLVNLTAPTFRVSAGNSDAGAVGTQSVSWNGSLGATYTYLNHAAPSFSNVNPQNSLTLDFGSLQPGSHSALSWDMSNLGDTNTVGLDLDGFSTSSPDAAYFDTGLSSTGLFSGLAPGAGRSFTASLDTTQAGSFAATYILHLSDADVGVASSRHAYDFQLTLTGVVVPLPAAWALMASGLGLFGWAARRRADSA